MFAFRKIYILFCSIVLLFILLLAGCSNTTERKFVSDGWQESLYVPTMVQKINDTYFIVDCWHHRVIYNDNLSAPIGDWKTMTDESYIGGHTIASDGDIFVLENTDNSQVLCYTKTNSGDFVKTNTLGEIGGRPHFTVYDEKNKLFYTISSVGAKVYIFENQNHKLNLVSAVSLEELKGGYCRSISLIDGKLYTSAAGGKIYEYAISYGKFSLEASYDVAECYAGMNQITKIQDYYYITVNTDSTGDVGSADILCIKDLSELAEDNCKSVKMEMRIDSQPYFITYFDGHYYVTYISAELENGIKQFDVANNAIFNVSGLYETKKPDSGSIERYRSKYPISFDNKNGRELVDLVVFAGQSNMSGKSNDPQNAPEALHGYEFRAITDPENLYHIFEPFGINENMKNGIDDTWPNRGGELRKCGGMVSAFANAYFNASGIPIVAVSASEGATTISQWTQSGRLEDLSQRILTARSYLSDSDKFELRYVFLVWCQGESDGDIGTGYRNYLLNMSQLYGELVKKNKVDSILVIQTGDNAENTGLYDEVQRAQKDFCEQYTDCEMISVMAKTFVSEGMMLDQYHYTQAGYNKIGQDAGENAGKYAKEYSSIKNE